jgi:conjugal transfer pilus assembly protein TraA
MKNLTRFKNYLSSKRGKSTGLTAAALVAVSVVAPQLVIAASSSTDTDFQSGLDLVIGWAQGTLGRLTAVSFLVVGIVMGVMRQSIFAAVPAIAAAVAMYIGPDIITGVFSAALPTV